MARMKQKDAAAVAALLEALAVIPKIKKALSNKGPREPYDAVWLELSAAEMQDGEGQGSSYYCYLPPEAGTAVLDAAGNAIRKALAKYGVEVS